jgi:hypothetical protein
VNVGLGRRRHDPRGPTGDGRPLDPAMRQRAEATTGQSLDHVRVHDDVGAQRWVDGEGALGLSLGHDVALGSGARRGLLREAVLAHEVAHAAGHRTEGDADRAAAGMFTGERVGSAGGRGRSMGLRRCDGDAPPKVKEAAEKTDPAKLTGFEKMVKGGVPAKDAADSMQLPKELRDAMDEAWKNSLPGGESKEQGGILVKKADGTLDWVKATKTTSGSTTLPWDKVPKGATPLADAHTHPYSKGEGGHKGVAFSGGDFSTMPADPTRVSAVHAADRYFVLAKTKEFEDAAAKAPDKAKLGKEMKDTWDKVYAASKGDIPTAAREATVAVCKKYGLILYEGDLKGEVKKVDVSK